MKCKDFFVKKVVPYYFMIVTFINIGMLAAGALFFWHVKFDFRSFAVPPVMGAVGCVPFLFDYAAQNKKLSYLGSVLLNLLEFAALEFCVMTVAFLVGIIKTFFIGAVLFCMVAVIFAAVGAIQYWQDRQLCLRMNTALCAWSGNDVAEDRGSRP